MSIVAVPILGGIPIDNCSEMPANGSVFLPCAASNRISTGCSNVDLAIGDMFVYFATPCLVVAVIFPLCVIQSTNT